MVNIEVGCQNNAKKVQAKLDLVPVISRELVESICKRVPIGWNDAPGGVIQHHSIACYASHKSKCSMRTFCSS